GEEGMGISLAALRQGGNGQNLAVFVSPQMRHPDPYSNFGAATRAAFSQAMSMGIGEVRIPAGVYIIESTVDVTLSMSMALTFDPGVIIYVDTPMDVFNINVNKKFLSIEARNARIMSRWGSADGSNAAAFRLTDATLDKSLSVNELKVGMADAQSKFGYAIHCTAMNLPTFHKCLLQGIRGIYLQSAAVGGASAHAMGLQIAFCEIYTTYECVLISNVGALGSEGILITGGELMCAGTAVVINNDGLDNTTYLPPLVRISGTHFNSYRAVYAKDVARLFIDHCDFQMRHSPLVTGINGLIELSGVQGFIVDGCHFSSVGYNGGTNAMKASPIYQYGSRSILTNAFVRSIGNMYQMDGMTKPVFGVETETNTATVTSIGDSLTSLATWTESAYRKKIRADERITIGDVGASAGLGYSTDASFSGGVLTLNSPPSQGWKYIVGISVVPNGSTITQIIVPGQLVGKRISIQFSAASLTFTHGANMVCVDQRSFTMSTPNSIQFFILNTIQSLMEVVGGNAYRHTGTTHPTSSNAPGIIGEEYFDTANKRWFKFAPDGRWYYWDVTSF
ncbi:hypothetical protein GOY50_26350, partial [Klebsiella pneumoniae]